MLLPKSLVFIIGFRKSQNVFKVKNFLRQLWFNFTNEPISDKKTNSRLFVPQPTSWVHTSRYCSCLERFFCMNSYHHSVFHSSGKPWQEPFFRRIELSCKIRFHWNKNTVITSTTFCSVHSFSFNLYLDSFSLMQKAQVIVIHVRETNEQVFRVLE